MSRHRKRVSRREFLRDAALATGGLTWAALSVDALAQAPAGGAPPKLGAQLIGKLEGVFAGGQTSLSDRPNLVSRADGRRRRRAC